MKKQMKISLSILTASIIFSGCASTISESFDKSFNNVVNPKNPDEIVLDNKKMPDLSKRFKNEEKKITSLSLSNSISLEKALLSLSKIDKKKYHLHKDTTNIMLPPANIKIHNFTELRLYIEDTLEKTIKITKNAIIKDRVKVVRVQDLLQTKFDLSKVDFSLNDSVTVKESLKLLSANKQFNFSISIDNEDFESTNDKKLFKEVYINFKGKTVDSFFKYLENKLNIFIDVDYENKIVNFKKYKKRSFALNIPKINMSVNSDSNTEVTKDSEGSKTNISETKNVDIYKQITKSFNTLLNKSKDRGNKRSYYLFDKHSGNIIVYADPKTLEEYTMLIEKTNNAYKDMINIEVLSFDIVFSKDYLFETGLAKAKNTPTESFTVGSTNSLTSTINSLLSLTKNKLDATGNIASTTSYLFDSLQQYGQVVNKKSNIYLTRNHIPKSTSKLNTERYLKDIIVIDPTTDTGSTKEQTSTDVIQQPEGFNIISHYNNGMISIELRDYSGELVSMGELGSGTSIVSNPKTKSTESVENIYMKNGESFIIKNETSIATTKDFKGMLPTEWLLLNSINGGENEKILYTQSIKILRAYKANNL